jgi:prepilin-type processing-associated H-X9-DG protein
MTDQYPTTFWEDIPAIYHAGGCGFSFADGHSEIRKWENFRTLQLKTTYIYNTSGKIYQGTNLDIVWLQQRTTAKY